MTPSAVSTPEGSETIAGDDHRQDPWICVPYESVQQHIQADPANQRSLCVHVHCIPLCGRSDAPIQSPVLAADGILYEKSAIIEYLQLSNVSPVKRTPLQSKNLIPVRVASLQSISSKIGIGKCATLTQEQPLVLVCRVRNEEDTALIIVERQVEHGYGLLEVHRFAQKLTIGRTSGEAEIVTDRFDGL